MINNPEELLAHADFVRNLARRLVMDENAADDIAQDTLLTALLNPMLKVRSLRSWLYKVTRNFSYKKIRGDRRRWRREGGTAVPDIVPSSSKIAEREEIRGRVVEAVMALEEPYRSTVLLRFYEDLPVREIARQFQAPLDTVRTRLKRGLNLLRLELDRRHGGDSKTWRLALLPIAGLHLKGMGLGSSTIGSGVIAMITKTKLLLLVPVLLLGVLGWVFLSEMGGGQKDQQALPETPADLSEKAEQHDIGNTASQEEPGRRSVEQKKAVLPAGLHIPVTGRLLSRLDNRGVIGARVRIHVLPSDKEGIIGMADDQGRFSLNAPFKERKDISSIYLHVSAKGYRDLVSTLPAGPGPVEFGALYLDRDRVHTLEVVDPEGKPVANARFSAYWGNYYFIEGQLSDPEGRILVADSQLNLERIDERPLYLWITAKGMADYYGVYNASTPIPKRVVLERAGVWRGRVVDSQTRHGIANTRVLVSPETRECPFMMPAPTLTNGDGAFQLKKFTYDKLKEMRFRDLMLVASAVGHGTKILNRKDFDGDFPPAEIELEPAFGEKTVKLMDGKTKAPLIGFKLRISVLEEVITDDGGCFTYPYQPEENTRFTIHARGYKMYAYACKAGENADGQTKVVYLQPSITREKRGGLVIVVKDEMGLPVAGASTEVSYWVGQSAQISWMETDQQGRVVYGSFSSWKADPRVKITCVGFCPLLSEPIPLDPEKDTEKVFVLKRGILLQGMEVKDYTGQPLADAAVLAELFNEHGKLILGGGDLYAITDDLGRCDFVLPPFHEGYFYTPDRPDCAVRIDLASVLRQDRVFLRITRHVSPDAMIRGRVTDHLGNPMNKVHIALFAAKDLYNSKDYNYMGPVVTDDNGVFCRTVFRHKGYKLRFSPSYYNGALYTLDEVEIFAGVERNLTLCRHAGIHIPLRNIWRKLGRACAEYDAWLENEQGKIIKGIKTVKDKHSVSFLSPPAGKVRAVLVETDKGRMFHTGLLQVEPGQSLKAGFDPNW